MILVTEPAKRLRIFDRSQSTDGRTVIVAPIIGKDGKVHQFVLLDTNDSLPIPRQESETFLLES